MKVLKKQELSVHLQEELKLPLAESLLLAGALALGFGTAFAVPGFFYAMGR